MMDKTIFQRIVDKEIPATIEFEDDEIIAIRDVAPNAPVHILIVPKRPIRNLNELVAADAELVGRVFLVARDLAQKFGVSDGGYRVVTNCNADAGQTVFHLHFHLLGGQPLGSMTSTRHVKQGASPGSVLRETGILILCAIGLAIGFNQMNTKSVTWVKKEYERAAATTNDVNKYLAPDTANIPKPPTNTISVTTTSKPAPTVTTAVQQPTAIVRDKPSFVAEPGLIKEITYDQFARLMASGLYYLIDARGADKYVDGHIGNAVNFYGGEVQSKIPELLQSVPRDRIILIYCDGGECELSHHVADVLKQFQYGPIFIFTGGWAEWKTKH